MADIKEQYCKHCGKTKEDHYSGYCYPTINMSRFEPQTIGCGKEITHEFFNTQGQLYEAFDDICGENGNLCPECQAKTKNDSQEVQSQGDKRINRDSRKDEITTNPSPDISLSNKIKELEEEIKRSNRMENIRLGRSENATNCNFFDGTFIKSHLISYLEGTISQLKIRLDELNNWVEIDQLESQEPEERMILSIKQITADIKLYEDKLLEMEK